MSTAFVAILSTVLMVVLLSNSVNALSCPDCDEAFKAASCPPLPACQYGATTDMCGCCPECEKAENEECGGIWGQGGTCASDFVCEPNPIEEQEPGRCVRRSVITS